MTRYACIAILFAAFGCYTTATTSRTYTAAGPPQADVGKTGSVVAVNVVTQRVEGNPAGGAVAGALIGGALFHGSAGSTLFGAAAGAVTGGALSSGRSEQRAYEVHVQFEDGTAGAFDYADYSPFAPGDRVVLTPSGLARM
jgi:outer membrane lipoprotein SlyB